VSRSKAEQIVLAQIAKNDERCATTVGLFGMLPAARGWTASAHFSGGKANGWAVWKVVGSSAIPSNPIARKVFRGCH
jgi:hypothetical protein